jgi:hypothetical protein
MPNIRIKVEPARKKITLKIIDKEKVLKSFTLKAKTTFNGNILIYDHDDVEIVIMPETNKIVTFKQDGVNSDIAYGASDRLFRYLATKGIIDLASVQGGNTVDSFEATILENDLEIPTKLVLLSVSSWIEKERPYFEYGEDYEDMMKDRLLEPDDEEATELGEVPHDKSKGSIVPGYYRSPYWMSYILEEKEK